MTMHEHDRDLIMSLASGELDAAATERAMAGISSCAECTTELAEQRQALAALSALGPVSLTELEAARLARDLDSTLGHVRSSPAVTSAPRRRSLWVPVGSAAAILLVLFLVAPALQLLGGDDDSGGDVVAFDAEVDGATEEPAAEADEFSVSPLSADDSGNTLEEMEAADDGGERGTDGTATQDDDESAADTTAAAAEDLCSCRG